jgi:hypothetical protein
LRGEPYRPGGPDILVSNGHIHKEIQEAAAEIATQATRL